MLSADQEWENFLNTDTLQDSNEEKSSDAIESNEKLKYIYGLTNNIIFVLCF